MTHGPSTLRRTLLLSAALCIGAPRAGPRPTPAAAAEPSAVWRVAEQESGQPVGQEAGQILVLAASSLTDVLPLIGGAFEVAGGGVVHYSFDATSRLAVQVEAGAPADVLISADEEWIEWLAERDLLAGVPLDIAGNELVLVVPTSSLRRDIGSVDDLRSVGTLAVGGENVPVGRYARRALASAGVLDEVRDRLVTAGSARGVLEWVARGEVDAGIVYRTDASAEPAVATAFTFPREPSDRVVYRAARLSASDRPELATRFLTYLSSPTAEAMLRDAGFAAGDVVVATGAREPETVAPGQATAGPPEIGVPSVGSAIRLSLLVALLATLVGLVPAVALGWLLARHDFPGKTLVSTFVLAPLVMPPVVTGFLLLSLLGRQGLLGAPLASLGISVPFTLVGATIAALIVGFPLYVLAARGAFEAVDPLYEELSWTLGRPPLSTFLRVSLPLALPGIAAGAILAFARALGEFGATVVLAGNVEGSTRTIALAVYTLLEAPGGRETTWMLVASSVALSLLALVGFEALNRRQRRRVREDHGR